MQARSAGFKPRSGMAGTPKSSVTFKDSTNHARTGTVSKAKFVTSSLDPRSTAGLSSPDAGGRIRPGRKPPYLFLTGRGTPVTEDYISDTWGRCAKAVGIASRFHNNRSSYATHVADVAAELGQLPMPVVKDLLGHANQATSERYVKYSELRNRILMEAHIINDNYEREAAP